MTALEAERLSGGVHMLTAEEHAALPFLDRCLRRLPIVDRASGDFSLTRCLCAAFTIIIFHIVEQTHQFTWSLFWLSVVVMSAAFGKSSFGFFLQRIQLGASVTEVNTRTVVDQTTRTIAERRDPVLGIEPTP